MQDKPDTTALLAAISALLKEEIVPALSGRLSLQARIAANCLNIIRRELLYATEDERAETARLEALLGKRGSLEDLNKDLCQQISQGKLGLDNTALMGHLWQTTLCKVRIDQPDYPTYQRFHKG